MPYQDKQSITVYVTPRPGVQNFLKQLKNYYEIVIFTSSQKEYADEVINKLEAKEKYVLYRLYREHCTLYHCNYLKDLNKLGRNMEDIIIIDQANGYLISSFFNDMKDNELMTLLPFLIEISKLPDTKNIEQLKLKYDQNDNNQNQALVYDSSPSEDINDEEEEGGISAQANASLAQFQSKKMSGPSEKLEELRIQSQKDSQIKKKEKAYIDQMLEEQKNSMIQKLSLNQQKQPDQIKIFSKVNSMYNQNNFSFKSHKSFGFQFTENFAKSKFSKDRKKQILEINELRFEVDRNNIFSPLARQQYFDNSSEIFLV